MLENNIHNIAVHDLVRSGEIFQVNLGNNEVPITPTTQRVIGMLSDLYGKRASKSYGKFSSSDVHYPTQGFLREYVRGDIDFAEFTSRLMDGLRIQATRKSAATGGHVFFAHFVRENKEYILVAIVNDRLGAALTSSFDMQDVNHLDMDGFRFAGRINLTGWSNDEDRYIGFLKGKGNVAEYFKEFLGCDSTVFERQETRNFVESLKKFAEDRAITGVDKDNFLTKAKEICERYSSEGRQMDFGTFANELVPESPDFLLDFIATSEMKLSEGFVPDRRALHALVKFRGKTKLWSLEFEREALSGGAIIYSESENSITITDIPEELAINLRSEIGED